MNGQPASSISKQPKPVAGRCGDTVTGALLQASTGHDASVKNCEADLFVDTGLQCRGSPKPRIRSGHIASLGFQEQIWMEKVLPKFHAGQKRPCPSKRTKLWMSTR